MDPNFLSIDELEIECVIRKITGSLSEQLKLLDEALTNEFKQTVSSPQKAHLSAQKSPQRELALCCNKLRELKPQVQEIALLHPDQRKDKLFYLHSRILHVRGRFQRLFNTSPTYRPQSLEMLTACDKLLDAIKSLVDDKLSVNDFEKSICEAIPVASANDENLDDSGESDAISEVLITTQTAGVCEKNGEAPIVPPSQIISSPTRSRTELTTKDKNDNIQIAPTGLSDLNIIRADSKRVPDGELATVIEAARRISVSENIHFPVSSNILNPNMSTPRMETKTKNPVSSDINLPERVSHTIGIHKWNISFDGSPTSQPIERFLYRVERLSGANNVPFDRLVNDLHILLRKNALEWYWSYLERKGDVEWLELKKEMRIRFQDRRTDFEIRQSIAARKQKSKESFLEFYSDLLDSTLALSQPISDYDLYFMLRQNMSTDLQYKLAGKNITSVGELVTQCIDIEDTWKRLNIHHESAQRVVHELVSENQIPLSFGNMVPIQGVPAPAIYNPTGNGFYDNNGYYWPQEVSAISVESKPDNSSTRFLAIWWPLKLQITKKRARLMILCIWIIALGSTIPWALFFELIAVYPEAPEVKLCLEVWPPGTNGALYFLVANLVACYVLPMLLISLCYILIWIKVWRRSIPGDSKDAQMDRMQQKSKVKVVKMLVAVVILFVLSWLPLYLIFARIKFYGALDSKEEEILQIATPIAQWLGSSNSCINPILYAFFNKKYRLGFAAIIRSRKCCGRLRYYENVAIASSSTSTRKSSHYHNNQSSARRSPHSPSIKSDAVSYIYDNSGKKHSVIAKQDSNLSRQMLLKQDSTVSRSSLVKQDSNASRQILLKQENSCVSRQDSNNSRQMLLKQDSSGSRNMLTKQDSQISYIETKKGQLMRQDSDLSKRDYFSKQDSVISYIEPRRGILCKQDTQISYIESKKNSLSSQDSVVSFVEHRKHQLVKQDSVISFADQKPESRRHQLVKQDSIISFADQTKRGCLTKQDSIIAYPSNGRLNGEMGHHVSILKKTDSLGSNSPVRKTIEFLDK